MLRAGTDILGAGANTIRWSPPLILTKENVDVALEIFDDAITASLFEPCARDMRLRSQIRRIKRDGNDHSVTGLPSWFLNCDCGAC